MRALAATLLLLLALLAWRSWPTQPATPPDPASAHNPSDTHASGQSGGSPAQPEQRRLAPDPDAGQDQIITARRITGRVLGEDGRPVPGVRVRATQSSQRRVARVTTDSRGRFSLELPARFGTPPSCHLDTYHQGFHGWRSPLPIPWGTADLEIELRAYPGLQIFVTRASNGSPVIDYYVHANWELRGSAARGKHPQGAAILQGLGSYVDSRFLIEPKDPDLAPSEAIMVGKRGRDRRAVIRIQLAEKISRQIHVSGLPAAQLAQVTVELCRPDLGWEAMPASRVFRVRAFGMMPSLSESNRSSILGSHQPSALLLSQAKLPADGRLELRAAAHTGYFLRITGPCIPQFVHPVAWRADLGPLQVRLQTGTTLRVRASLPPPLMARLKKAAGEPPLDPARSPFRPRIESLSLVLTPIEPEHPKLLAAPRAELDGKGRCELSQVPPGRWRARLIDPQLPHWSLPLTPEIQVVPGLTRQETRLRPRK